MAKPFQIGHPEVQADDYRLLKEYGFGPAKAAEVVLDARRGDEHARGFIELARRHAADARLNEGR